MNRKQLEELLYQALETEIGGVQVYATAIKCAENEDLRKSVEKLPRRDAGARTHQREVLHRPSVWIPRRRRRVARSCV